MPAAAWTAIKAISFPPSTEIFTSSRCHLKDSIQLTLHHFLEEKTGDFTFTGLSFPDQKVYDFLEAEFKSKDIFSRQDA